MRAKGRGWREGLLRWLQDGQIAVAASLRKTRDRRRDRLRRDYYPAIAPKWNLAERATAPDRVQARPKMRGASWPRSRYTARRYQPIPPTRTKHAEQLIWWQRYWRNVDQAVKRAKARLPLRRRLTLFVVRRLWLWLSRRWHR